MKWSVMTGALLLGLAHTAAAEEPAQGNTDLEQYRQAGDLRAQRRHVWDLLADLTQPGADSQTVVFESWYGEAAVFAKTGAAALPLGMHGFSRLKADRGSTRAHGGADTQSTGVPVLTYTLYNPAAYWHIRRNRLYARRELDRLKMAGDADPAIADDRTVPEFPAQAMVLKTAWWPVSGRGPTALPVWDPEHESPRASGNDYATWRRVVAVYAPASPVRDVARIDFAGTTFQAARGVGTADFYHVVVDASMARQLNRDAEAARVGLMALGRGIAVGDYLVLVSVNLATKEISDWIWATAWWHDRANAASFAADRPARLGGAWRHYLLQVAFDEQKPAAADGGPHVCFNPWLEARFPDGGYGGGTVGNCLACHRRASYPLTDFLPVTRGAPDLANDPAYAAVKLRTNFLWSLALHSRN